MKLKDLSTKERIISATIDLIMENKEVNQIPISSIAERAGVGIGLINYHFQTKENLINQCVQQVIGKLFGSFEEVSANLTGLQPADKLKSLIQFIAAFMAENRELARISTLTDLSNGKENDNSSYMMKTYYPFIKEAFQGNRSEKEQKVILLALISTIQVTFLRSDINDISGFDFFDPDQRNEFLEILVDLLK
ncbi:MAG: TetR/AcrR family transcriptional regulator [Peptococcaceae bacterium]|nr:TetR/AcrR family transcriptional regulator [Peptococcaceae bacterium]